MTSPAQRLADKKARAFVPPKSGSVYPLTGPAPKITRDLLAPPLTTHLFRAQQGRCFHCLKSMARGPWRMNRADGWTREHVIPKAKGGNDRLNVVLAHRSCNIIRADHDLSIAEMGRARMIILAAHIVRRREGWPWADAVQGAAA